MSGVPDSVLVPDEAPFIDITYHCLGAALARTELGEALPALAARLGAPSVIRPVTWRPPLGVYGPEALHLRFSQD